MSMGHENPELEKLLPLRPRDYLILYALTSGAQHGYGIIRTVEQETDGTARLDPANLYRAVKRLSRQGLVSEAEDASDDEEATPGERRRYWQITELGRRVVTAEAARLAQLTALARASGLIPGAEG